MLVAVFDLQHKTEGSPTQFFHHFVLVVQFRVIGSIGAFELVGFEGNDGDRGVCWFPERRTVKQSQLFELIEILILHIFLVGSILLIHFKYSFYYDLNANH